jgi:hypothetical protein
MYAEHATGKEGSIPEMVSKDRLIVTPTDFLQPSPVADELASAEQLFSLTASQPNRVTYFVGINHTVMPCLVRRYAMHKVISFPASLSCHPICKLSQQDDANPTSSIDVRFILLVDTAFHAWCAPVVQVVVQMSIAGAELQLFQEEGVVVQG